MTSCLPSGSGFIREEACVVKEGYKSTSMCVCGGGGGSFSAFSCVVTSCPWYGVEKF